MSNLFDLFSSFEQLRPRFDFAAAFRDIWYRLVGTRIRQAKVTSVLRMAEEVYVTGSGDPFGSNHFRRVLKRLSDDDLSHLTIDLHTNGQLFDERAWNDLGLSGRVGYVHISIDAAQPATYSVVRRGGSFERLRKNLAFVRELRRKGQIRFLEFSMVVQTRNFREMPVFARLGQEFSADAVSFQMIRNWGTFSDAEFKEEFIGDRSHPRHRELIDVLSSPDLTLPIVRIGNVVGYAAESVQ